jgi:hypothetical protein
MNDGWVHSTRVETTCGEQLLALAVVEQAIRDLPTRPRKKKGGMLTLQKWMRSEVGQWWIASAGVDDLDGFIDYICDKLAAA